MPIPTPLPDEELLATPLRVGRLLAQDVDSMEQVDDDSLHQACEDATGLILEHLMRDDVADVEDLTAANQSAVVTVATRVALRIYRNPRDLGSYSYEGVSQTYTDPRILTPDEVRALKSSRATRMRRTAIVMEPVRYEDEVTP